METWNRWTAVREEWGAEGEKVMGSAKEHVCITHSHRQQCGDGQRAGRAKGRERWAKGEKMGTAVTNNTNKVKKK